MGNLPPDVIETETGEDFYAKVLAAQKKGKEQPLLSLEAAQLLRDFITNIAELIENHCSRTNSGIETRLQKNIIRPGDMELSIKHLNAVTIFEEALKRTL